MNNLLEFPAPNNKKELFERLRKILKLGWQEMPADTKRYNGSGGAGCYLEDLLGLKVGNQDIADVAGWEVKLYTPKNSLITLFHKEPDSKVILRYMVSRFGITDRLGRKSFRHTIKGESEHFKVVSDAGNIIVRPFDELDGPVALWSHDTLLSIAGGKLRRLVLVYGERKGRMVNYQTVNCYENLLMTGLINNLVLGKIAIDFDAREKEAGHKVLRNHGTKFRISPNDIGSLYKKKERLS
jgi:hypothetical protein